jgi:hypothetical protein
VFPEILAGPGTAADSEKIDSCQHSYSPPVISYYWMAARPSKTCV